MLVPLRASRSVFLPLWNNVDYSGEQWRETPPPEEEDDEEEGKHPVRVCLSVICLTCLSVCLQGQGPDLG